MTGDVGQLFETYHESLVRMLWRRTGDRDRAEDIAQETFARAVVAPPRNPRPWLFAVALNLVREDARKGLRQGRRLQLLKNEQEPAPAPDAVHERNEEVARVRGALAQLNERAREGGNWHHALPRATPSGRSVSGYGRHRQACRTLTKERSTRCSMASSRRPRCSRCKRTSPPARPVRPG